MKTRMKNSTASLKVGLAQHACGPDIAANLSRSLRAVRDLAKQGAQLVVLQELHASTYFCQTEDVEIFDLAEAIPGPRSELLASAAKECGVVLVSSLFERRAAGLAHNTAVVFERDGSIAGRYRKMHIPDDPGYYEKFYFTPGDLGFTPIETSVGRLGVLVCWDQWFPEAARLMALAGADLLIYPTAIGWHPDEPKDEQVRQLEAWTTVQRGHAVANGLPLLACNRVGHEPDPAGGSGSQFWGHSFVCGPQGEFLYRAGTEAENILVELDMGRAEQVRRMWPFLRDRRIDAYADLTQRYLDPKK
jgi:N-carbamoylputrescine amidase